jgi:hypothetical protein
MMLSVCLLDTSLSHEINSTPQLLVGNFRITQTKEILTGKRTMYHGGQLYWWGKPEHTEKTTHLPQVTGHHDIIVILFDSCILYTHKKK